MATKSNEAAKKSPGIFSRYQKFVVAVLAFLQFTIVLDFMLMAPLGAFVIPKLEITASQFGLVVSSYAFSAGLSGLLTAGFADRFDRKKLLLFFYSGFVAGGFSFRVGPYLYLSVLPLAGPRAFFGAGGGGLLFL